METQTPQKNEPISPDQEAKWRQIHDDLLRKHGGNKRRVQRILGNPNYTAGVIKLMNDCGIGNEYASERVEPNLQFDYNIRTLPGSAEQIAKQLEAMGMKGTVEAIRHTVQETLHPEADGFGAIPSISDLGAHWGVNDPLGDGYCQIVEQILGCMVAQRGGNKFHNYRAGELTANHIRLFWLVREMWQHLEALVPAEPGKLRFFIIPMNFGKKYQGFSPRNARMDALDLDAMPLDPVSVTALLLGWPERQQKFEDSVIDCSGAEYSWGADGGWSYVCCFGFGDSGLRFHAYDADDPRGFCGAAVAFPGVLQLAD